MSLTSVTGSRVLEVPATPATPLADASLSRSSAVVPQAALGSEKVPKDRLVLVDALTGRPDLVRQMFAQVYGWTGAIVTVESWEQVVREIANCSRIGELLFYSHAVYDALSVNGTQKTSAQFIDAIAPVAPSISSIIFEGCVIGNDLVGLHEMATRLRVSRVQGWTYWHYLDWWRPVPTGDAAAALTAFQPAAARAEPYLPASPDGARTVSVSDQSKAFATSTLSLAGEYFVESLYSEVKPSFEAAILNSLLTPDLHRPRASAEYRLIDSSAAQGALEPLLISTRPPFARVVMTPW